MLKYKVVRSYAEGDVREKDLQKSFEDGWNFTSASGFISSETNGGTRRYGYIEYILCKQEDVEKTLTLCTLYSLREEITVLLKDVPGGDYRMALEHVLMIIDERIKNEEND